MVFSPRNALLAVVAAFATTASQPTLVAGDDATSLDAILDEIHSMRQEHAAELEQMQQAHTHEMQQLKNALQQQRVQLATLTGAGIVAQSEGRRKLASSDIINDFSGINIQRDSSRISFGDNLDVHIVRTDDGMLEIFADDIYVHGTLHADAIELDNTTLTTGVTLHTVAIEVLTSEATSSDSVDTIYVEFYLPNFAYWSEPMVLLEGTDQGEVHEQTFELPDIPSLLRLSTGGNDAWGFQQMAVWIDSADEMVIVCPGVVGSHPEMGDNGHWIDGDGSGGAPTTVTHEIRSACASEVEVTVVTGDIGYSDTSNTVYVSFYIDDTDEWTDALPLFTGTEKGDTETETYGLAGQPSQIAFTISSTNAWGFDYLEVVVDGFTFVLSCVGDQSDMSSESEHWVDGDGSNGVTDELVLTIEHTSCDSSS